MNDREYGYLKLKIRQLLNIDIDAYKSHQMRRRLEAFVSRYAEDAMHFCRKMETDPLTLSQLRDMLTINVSEFFRDPVQFHHLQSVVLPELLEHSFKLNIWSAGCSHGEEPYSVAILLTEVATSHRVRILATDLDRDALARAAAGGPYPQPALRNVPQHQLDKYFSPCNEGYMVKPVIRRRVEFREHNLLADHFESDFDLIICRNVMIYFASEVKSTLFHKFHSSLKPDGVLFIGGAEALFGTDGLGFERLVGNFYRKAAARRAVAGTAVRIA